MTWSSNRRLLVYLCEFNDTAQWYIPLMDSAAILNREVSRCAISDEESPCRGGGVCSGLAFLLPLVLGFYAQSAHPCDLRMKNTVHSLIQTNGVLTAKQIGSVMYTQRACEGGSTRLGMTPGGGCKPGPRSKASAAAAIACAVAFELCPIVTPICRHDIAAPVVDRRVGK